MTFPRALARYPHGAVDNMTLHLAGHAAFADLEHVGRKSGIVRHTPVRGHPPVRCASCARGWLSVTASGRYAATAPSA
jgi:hypothetical protein